MITTHPQPVSAAIIGSFRQHYDEVCQAIAHFLLAGWRITSPSGAEIMKPGIPFVRFTTDPDDWDDPTVQTVALHRILRADLVYVVAPDGYVGRTTCYEIGRVVQADRPVYFSSTPRDLPILIPPEKIISPASLAARLRDEEASRLFDGMEGSYAELERRLVSGDYVSD